MSLFMKRRVGILFVIALFCLLIYGFSNDNSYFKITRKDVELEIPEGFPSPVC